MWRKQGISPGWRIVDINGVDTKEMTSVPWWWSWTWTWDDWWNDKLQPSITCQKICKNMWWFFHDVEGVCYSIISQSSWIENTGGQKQGFWSCSSCRFLWLKREELGFDLLQAIKSGLLTSTDGFMLFIKKIRSTVNHPGCCSFAERLMFSRYFVCCLTCPVGHGTSQYTKSTTTGDDPRVPQGGRSRGSFRMPPSHSFAWRKSMEIEQNMMSSKEGFLKWGYRQISHVNIYVYI